MAIPNFEQIMLPLLQLCGDNNIHGTKEAYSRLGDHFKLTEAERAELLPSGKQPIFENRVLWARFYLDRAGLLESPARGKYRITDVGLQVLKRNPPELDERYLRQFPKFAEWRRIGRAETDETSRGISAEESRKTPEENLESSYTDLHNALVQELIDKVKSMPSTFFERLVVELLLKMGYGGSLREAGQVIGRSGDGGIDGLIKEDKLGLDVIYLQAKRWQGPVPVGEVRDFAGSLDFHGAKKGVFITTSSFTPDARSFVSRIGEKKIVLIDGYELARLMIEYDVGVTTVNTYAVKRIDSDYFEEE